MNRFRRWCATHETWLLRGRAVLVGLVIVAGGGLILHTVHPHYPIEEWLFWRYASYWIWTVLFGVGCLSAGHRIQRFLSPRPVPVAEHLVMSMALGVFAFFLGMFLAGLAGLYGPVFAVVWPVLLTASGAWPLQRYLRRVLRHGRRALRPRVSPLQWIVLAYGLLAVFAVYFAMLTPNNAAYDARWYHLPLAEHYASQGGVARFPEGWFPGTGPHLASFLYTWCFLLPGTKLFDHVMLSAHLEYFLFLWTLAAVGPLVRRLLHGRRVALAWVATFLFPGILLYDSSLCLGADHVAAFWAIPIFLALLRFWHDARPRRAIPVALFISAATLTKYTAFMIVVLPIVAVLVRSLWVTVVSLVKKPAGQRVRKALLALLAFVLVGVVATMPHWLKNWVWYGDPIYPALHARLHANPWTPESAAYYQVAITDTLFRPDGENRVRSTLEVLFTFAFEPHNWPQFHGKVPVFGFLFAIGTVLLVFFRRTGRAWGLVLCTWCAVAVWFWAHAQDRYLQAALPWMVGLTAAVLVLVWRSHGINRVLLAGLVGLQIVWGGDVYFFRTHTMLHDSPVKATIDLIASGHQGEYEKRLQPFQPWSQMGEALPPGAKVVVHEEHVHLGLQSMTVNDWPGIQGGLNYGRLGSLRALHQRFVDWGVTHLVWTDQRSLGYDSLAGDLLFFHYATVWATDTQKFGGLRLARIPEQPLQEPDRSLVLYLGCPQTYALGLHELGAMILPERADDAGPYPPPLRAASLSKPDELLSLAKDATYVVHDAKCQKDVDKGVFSGFQKVARRNKRVDLWVRRGP